MYKLYNEDNMKLDIWGEYDVIFADYVYENLDFNWAYRYWRYLKTGGVLISMTDFHSVFEYGFIMKQLENAKLVNHLIYKNEWGNHPKDRIHQCFGGRRGETPPPLSDVHPEARVKGVFLWRAVFVFSRQSFEDCACGPHGRAGVQEMMQLHLVRKRHYQTPFFGKHSRQFGQAAVFVFQILDDPHAKHQFKALISKRKHADIRVDRRDRRHFRDGGIDLPEHFIGDIECDDIVFAHGEFFGHARRA